MDRPPSYSLASLLQLMTLVAILLGITMMTPGLGILLIILGVPAFIRTSLIVGSRQRRGLPAQPGEKLWFFLGSLGVFLAISIAFVSTFFAVCFGSGLGLLNVVQFFGGNPGPAVLVAVLLALGGGLVAAIVVVIKLLRRLWPYREK